jgi:zinc transport system ATP-binding protein
MLPAQDRNEILSVENLSVALGRTTVLKDVSFSVHEGEALAVLGPNGAGKTVLFRALLNLIPSQGAIRWREGTKIGYVPQKFLIDRSMPITALEFFLLKSRNFWRPSREFLRQIDEEIAIMGLDPAVLKSRMGELSGGQTQRVLIAWALLRQADVLLLDEPTAAVDTSFEDTIYSVIHRIRTERRKTILLISHDLNVVYRYAQNVLCLNHQLVCQGSPAEVLNSQTLAEVYGEAGYFTHRDPH